MNPHKFFFPFYPKEKPCLERINHAEEQESPPHGSDAVRGWFGVRPHIAQWPTWA